MKGEDTKRAHHHRRLFEKMLAKTDHKKDSKGRGKEAADKMDKKLGPQWREESAPDNIAFVHIEGPDMDTEQSKMDGYYDNMNKVSDEEGLPGLQEAPEASKEDAVNSMICRLKKILMGIL